MFATLRTIAKRGVAGASLAEIGEDAGNSRSLPAHVFGNKDKLLAECLQRFTYEYWTRDIAPAANRGPFATLAWTIRRWVHGLNAHTELGRAHLLILQEATVADAEERFPVLIPVVRQTMATMVQRFRDCLVAGKAAGELDPDLNVDSEAALIHVTLRGISQCWLIDPNSVNIKQVGEDLIGQLSKRILVQDKPRGRKSSR